MTSFLLRRQLPAAIALFLFGISLLAIPYIQVDSVPLFILFLGRLHPLVLHFPIVLIVLALLLEAGRHRYFPQIGRQLMIIVTAAAALASLVSIGAGYFLFASGDYSGQTIELHLWGGVVTGCFMFIAWAVSLLTPARAVLNKAFMALLILANLAVVYTSHLGGSVTHGEGYLTEHLELMTSSKNFVERPDEELTMYADVVKPVFEAKCLGCHNQQRAKGGFLMDSYASLFKAGDSGMPGILAGKADSSLVFGRVSLPVNHDDHMPPEGKTPLSADELSVISHWIKVGASDTSRIVRVEAHDSVKASFDRLLPELKRFRMAAAMARMKNENAYAELKKTCATLHLSVSRDSLVEGGLFSVAMKFPPVKITEQHFAEIRPFEKIISKISMTSAGLGDDALYYLSKMENVRVLYLQKNAIGGSGIAFLKNLKQLEVLNLSFNKIDDKSAIDLLEIPNLKTVYLYRTEVSPQVIEALAKNRPQVKILQEEGPYF